MQIIDLYSNYIGELEITFLEKNNFGDILFEVNLLYANFTSLMKYIPIPTEIHCDSVYYNWFNCLGFYDHELWECKRIYEFYNQLLLLSDLPLEADLNNEINALKQVCNSALQNDNTLFIEYL